MLYISLLFIFFTPPKNIIFDIDSRLNMDEIIQIIQPSSLTDFIYDLSFGGFGFMENFLLNCSFLKLLSFYCNTSYVHILMLINYSYFLQFGYFQKSFKKDYILTF